ncbi:MAG: TIGR02171 family protein [Fibrobacter sp.]|nr:TIGR02171 family protein [Fibrobacter sp.]
MKKSLAISLAFFSLFVACTSPNGSNDPENSGVSIEVEADSNLKGFMLVHSKGKHTLLGTDLTKATLKERPRMKVEFDYDFSLGKHEVTCGEFNEVMDKDSNSTGRESAAALRLDCDNDSLPAVNLTYFDAALFANAKSKALGMDTAYSYVSASFSSTGNCTSLEGFVFHPEAQAYRLPTEAEWILATSIKWAPSKEWNADNSDRKLQEVCTANNATEDSFCDLAGNVKEWVNDWLGNFRDTTVVNYVGAPDGGTLGQRVLKGGSYLHSAESANLYSRGDVYTVTSATKAAYVGFRLAYGKIPEPTWLDNNGFASSGQLSLLANPSTVKKLLGTRKAKLVFRNDDTHNLAFVDYSIAQSHVEEIVDTVNAYHPDISPDGLWVAFCTGLEGIEKNSALYVRRLNAKGDALVKLDVESAAIPRWRISNGDTVIVYVTSAAQNKEDASFKNTSTWQVPFSNGKFGKPQKLFDGNYHGGISGDNRLAVSGSTLLKARIAKEGDILQSDALDTVWYNEEQACNASLSKDDTKRTLFLDFASKTGRDFTGEMYHTHQRILMADSTGRLIHSVAAPQGYTFDHSEWISRQDFSKENLAIATLANNDGAHRKITLVNVDDSTAADLVEGDEIWHPCLWVGTASNADENIDLDSAGLYFENYDGGSLVSISVELAMKMKKFWQLYKEVEYLSFGSSMTNNAIFDDSVTVYKSLNMAAALSDLHFALYIIKNYAMPYAKKLKAISIELAPAFIFRTESDLWETIKNASPGFAYDEHHLQGNVETISSIAQEREYPRNLLPMDYIDDTFLLRSSSWETPDVPVDISYMTLDNPAIQMNIEKLVELKAYAAQNGIIFFMTITPRSPEYRDTDSFGYFGPSWNVARAIIEKIEGTGIPVFDEYNYGNHDYTSVMGSGSFHMSYLGAYQFTRRLNAFIEQLESAEKQR